MKVSEQIINLTDMQDGFYPSLRTQRARTYLQRTLKINDLDRIETIVQSRVFQNWWDRQYANRDKAFIQAICENADLREAHNPSMIRAVYTLLPGGLEYRSVIKWTHWTINPQREGESPILGYLLPPDELYDLMRRARLAELLTDYNPN